MDATKKQLEIMAAYEAGQSTPSVITAYQLRERLVSDISAHDAETAALVEQTEMLPSGRYKLGAFVFDGRQRQIARHRTALDVVIDLIDSMEAEQRAAEALDRAP